MYYIDQKHETLFNQLMDHAMFPVRTSTTSYQAAIYLLTSSDVLWSAIKDHIDHDRINFAACCRRGFGIRDYMTFLIAKDCISDSEYLRVQDLSDTKLLSEEMFRLVTQAIHIKRYSLTHVLGN